MQKKAAVHLNDGGVEVLLEVGPSSFTREFGILNTNKLISVKSKEKG